VAGFSSCSRRWQRSTNLVGTVTPTRLVNEHVAESLAALPLLPASGSLLDVGSGTAFRPSRCCSPVPTVRHAARAARAPLGVPQGGGAGARP